MAIHMQTSPLVQKSVELEQWAKGRLKWHPMGQTLRSSLTDSLLLLSLKWAPI